MTDKNKKHREDELDRLMHLALEEHVKKEAEAFSALDTTGFEKTPEKRAELQRMAKRRGPSYPRYGLRTAAVACILLLSMLFTACVFIPEVRQVLGAGIIELYDKYITVNFRPDVKDPPTTLEEHASLSYLPEGYRTSRRAEESDFTDILIYDENDELIFTFAQFTIYLNDIQYSFDIGDILTKVSVKGHTGTMILYPDENDKRVLIWTDGTYQYSLCGCFNSEEELLRIADGIKIK